MYAIINGIVMSAWDLEQERQGEQQHKAVPLSALESRELSRMDHIEDINELDN